MGMFLKKIQEVGVKEGFEIIKNHIIKFIDKVFDDFAGVEQDIDFNTRILGI